MSNWEKKTFQDAPIEIIDGDRGVNYPQKSDFSKTDYCLFLSTSNVTNTGFDFNSPDFISKEKDEDLRKGKLKKGDIVLTTRGTVGNVAFYNDKIPYENIRINSGMILLRADTQKIHPYYLYSFLKSNLFKKQVISQGSGSAQPQLPIGSLKNIVIPWLDFDTQQKIAAVLSSLDSKIELNNKINAELEAMAKTLYDYWFVQFDFPDSDGKPYKTSGGKMVWNDELKREIPDGGRVGTFGKYAKLKGGFAFKSDWWTESGLPVIKIKDINENYTLSIDNCSCVGVDKYEKAKNYEVFSGDVVIAMTGATVGKFGIVPRTNSSVLVNQRVGLFDLGKTPVLRLPFLICSLNQDYFRETIFLIASGAAQPNISSDQIDAIPLVIPKKEIIDLFNLKTSCFYKKIIANITENQTLSELRDWLLPMLMNGQVRVS
jgi:type I restriction enzyme S subunit